MLDACIAVWVTENDIFYARIFVF